MTRLKPSLSLFQITFLGVGTMIGAGIYVLVGKVAGISGALSIWAFIAATLIVSFSAYSHGYLAKLFPSSAGAAEYVTQAFNSRFLTTTIGLGVLLTGIVSSATLINGFHGYLSELVALPQWLVISILSLILFLVASQPVNTSVNFAVAITIVELLGLALVILFAQTGDFEPHYRNPSWSTDDLQLILAGAFVAFYAYVGFEDMVNLSEEVKKPESTMLLAVMLALIVTSVLYVLVVWVAINALPVDQLANSDAPFSTILAHTPWLAKTISLIGLVAIINGALVQILMGSRMLYGLGRDKLLPSPLTKLSGKRIPINATLLVALLVWLFALSLPLLTLAKLTSGIILAVFALVNASAAVIAFRRHQYGSLLIACIGTLLSILFVMSGISGSH